MAGAVDSALIAQQGTWLEIRTGRLLNNLETLKQTAGGGVHALAVVKANAYGHGLRQVAEILGPHVDYLGVSALKEALLLLESGIECPLFILGRLHAEELPAAMHERITLSVSSLEEARDISDLSHSLGRRTRVHVKVDTGMGRLGLPYGLALASIEKMSTLPGLDLEGIYTHFPSAEASDGFAERQLHDLELLVQALAIKGIRFRLRHAANSSGVLNVRHDLLNMIRPGLMLYGAYPDPALISRAAVEPVLSLKSRVMFVKRLHPGESTGYGRDFVTDRPTTIAILPVGYSYGYPFKASGRGSVLYKSERYPIAGRVSMDYLTVHFWDTPVKPGDTVTLIGEENGRTIRVEEVAGWAETIPYEIMTRLLPSLPRLYR